jgi:hypothetical protein
MPARETSENDYVARPFLAPTTEQTLVHPSSPSGVIRPVTASVPAVSSIHFLVHSGMPEIQDLAHTRGWLARGFTTISIPWTEMHWTVDDWKTAHVLRSSDVPCPVMNGFFFLPDVPVGTEVTFAVHAGVACHAPHDTAGNRDTTELWFNNQGHNYKQVTR